MTLNLAGQSFGRLTVLVRTGSEDNRTLWRCRCVCGQHKLVNSKLLRRGLTKSCGCLQQEQRSANCKSKATHGHWRSRTYKSWTSMKSRCTNPKAPDFSRYGGAGVSVCERWLSFENFLADMGERPEGTTLGRILDMGNYELGNAFWQTLAEQALAKRNKRALSNSGLTPTSTRKRVYAA